MSHTRGPRRLGGDRGLIPRENETKKKRAQNLELVLNKVKEINKTTYFPFLLDLKFSTCLLTTLSKEKYPGP